MTDLWMGWCAPEARSELMRALRTISPFAALVFASSAQELRERFAWEEPGTVGAIVGLSDKGVSDENLAAALAHDGRAAEIVLVTHEAAGSLRSRMARAGVTNIIEIPRKLVCADQVPFVTPSPSTEDSGKGLSKQAPTQRLSKEKEEASSGRGRLSQDSAKPGPAKPAGARRSIAGPSSGLAVRLEGGAPILSFVSGRGGVGKSALAAVSACVAASWKMDVALIDFDLSCGNLRSFFALGKGSDLGSLGGEPDPELLDRMGIQASQGIRLWGPCERPEMAEQVMPFATQIVNHACQTHDLVLIDNSTTFTDAVAQAVQLSDRALVVADGRPGSVASTARTLSLIQRLGVVRTRIMRINNFCDPRERKGGSFEMAQGGLDGVSALDVVDGGEEAEELLASGHAVELVQGSFDLAQSVASALAKTLSDLGKLPDHPQAHQALSQEGKKRRSGLFSRRREAS